MEEDSEVLDWGNEDDEQQYEQRVHNQHIGAIESVEDAEDAVSLGGDEDDAEHYYAYQSTSNQDPQESSLPAPKAASVPLQQQLASHGNRELQRDLSGSSHTPQAQSSPQQQPSTRPSQSQSLGKMTHSLPPKPVLSTIPFMQSTHPSSIIEATAMSLHRDKKSNGSIGKPISSGDAGDSLPPDWEIKQPRSGGGGVYYYNVRTHQSTWTRPVSGSILPTKDKDRVRTQTSDSRPSVRSGNSSPSRPSEQLKPSRSGRSEEPQAPPSALSYDDRHYRPGETAQIANVVEKRREERFDSNKRSSTPPRSPKMTPGLPLRPPSPIGRGRDEKRSSRSHRKLSPQAVASDLDSLRDSQKPRAPPRVSSPDRHWIAPQEPPPRKISGRRPASAQDHSHEDVEMSPASPTTNEDRSSFRNDAEWSSTLRHRSPPQHRREPRSSTVQTARTGDSGQPPQVAAPRAKSRFDQPANTPPKTLRAPPRKCDDVYIPAELLPNRSDREPELTSTQIGVEHEAKRRRTNEHAPAFASIHRAPPDPVSGPASLTERSASGSSSSLVPEQSRFKRPPLPPQSARFREMSKRTPPKLESISTVPHADQAPPAPKDGMMPRPTNVDSSLPSGPRIQPQIVTLRDTGHTDLRNNTRLPPSGPSAASTARSRPTFSANQQPPASRDRNAVDVDAAAPARPPPLRINDMPIRANSGMYADREQQRVEINAGTDAAPRGPRAMTNRMPTSSSLPPFVPSPSTSPTTPFYPQRLAGGQERTGVRTIQRSPPPHLVTNNVTPLLDGPPTGLSAGGMSRQNVPPRRASNASERGQPNQGSYQEVESRDQFRRELPGSHTRHEPFLQAPPPAPRGFSGSNSIPIGNRKGQSNGQVLVPSQTGVNRRPNTSFSGGNMERNRPSRGVSSTQNSFEAPILSPVEGYQTQPVGVNAPRRGRMTPPHQHRPISPQDSFQTGAVAGRQRGAESWFSAANTSRPGAFVPREASPPRTWTPRQQHPQYEHYEPNIRDETPPPSSREDSWDAHDRRHPPSQFPADDSQHANQFNGDARHVTGEPRHRRPLHVETDRVAPHPTTTRRGPVTLDARRAQQSEERYADDMYRSRLALSPGLHRHASFAGHESFSDAPRQDYIDDREPISERQAQSWDRDQALQRDQYSPILARGVHQDHAGMFEANSQSFSGPDHDPLAPRPSKPIRIRRPGSQSVPNRPDDFPVRVDDLAGHWPPNSGRGEERNRDEPVHRSHSHHQRPTPSRRGGSLLDRLSLDNGASSSSPSLRERVQIIPSKRDREEMAGNDTAGGDIDMDDGGPDDSASKKQRRRPKMKRGRRSGA